MDQLLASQPFQSFRSSKSLRSFKLWRSKAFTQITMIIMASLIFNAPLSADESVAVDDWSVTSSVWGSLGKYQKSQSRESHSHYGTHFKADFLESFSLDIGYQNTRIRYQLSDFKVVQDEYYAGGEYHLFSDMFEGNIGLAGHIIHAINNDNSGYTDSVTAFTTTLSYRPWSQRWNLEAGAAQSNYGGNFNVTQATATFGVGFNDNYDWLQIKGFAIRPAKNASTPFQTHDTNSAELSWKHWFTGRGHFRIDSVYVAGMLGKRQFAVDSSHFLLQNLSDIQTNNYSAGINFRLDDCWLLGFTGSLSHYRNETLGNQYQDSSIHINLSTKW